MKVALYSRVSSEEQMRHGISIEAQSEALRSWAKENGHEIVGEYVDPGISARKAPSKRPALQQLLADIPVRRIELVAFTKLDRWTRNVKGYYQVQDVLDRYKVAWIAVQEDYETITASGRFKVNIMLSVAENEADRTSERIKAVQAYKVALGQPVSGSLPIGLKIEGKQVMPDKYADAAREAFELYAKTGNKSGVKTMLREKYGLSRALKNIDRMLRNPIYRGRLGENDRFCEPLIPPELFDRVQDTLARRTTKQTPTGHAYLFAGLMVCAECGRRLAGAKNKQLWYYRCQGHYMYGECGVYHNFREDVIEQECLTRLAVLAKSKKATAPIKKPPQVNVAAMKQKLTRLKELYIDGDISKEQYLTRKNELTALLEAQKPPERPPVVLGDNFLAEYQAMNKDARKLFWRSVIDHITVYANHDVDIFFSPDLY